LRQGHPDRLGIGITTADLVADQPLPIKTGLTDGRHTEVSGEGLSEGMQVIMRNKTPAS
jgi:hypothetical protein